MRISTVERAYEIAHSGEACDITQLKQKLSREGYFDVNQQLHGPTISRALRAAISAARQAASAAGGAQT